MLKLQKAQETFMKAVLIVAASALLNGLVVSAAQPDLRPGFRSEFLKQLDEVEKKSLSLARAIPEEKFSWRPQEGVRSFGEVFSHLAGANYMFSNFIGGKLPDGVNPHVEKASPQKADITEKLRKSFAHARRVVMNMQDSDLDREVKMFGNMVSERQVLFVMANHAHEHLGQAIAYARMNGITPPW